MRVSVDRDDCGYNEIVRVAVSEIILDGQVMQNCITADEELGYVKAYVHDMDGRLIEENGEPKIIELQGQVEIRYSPGYSAATINEFAGNN